VFAVTDVERWVPSDTVDEAIRVEDPSTLSPRHARALYLDDRSTDKTAETVHTDFYQTKAFVEFAEERGIESISDVSGWHLDQFKRQRRTELKPISLKGQMSVLKQMFRYLARIDAVAEGMPEKIDVPTVEEHEETSDVLLETDDAKALIEYFRNSRARYGTKIHALLEVLWHTGCRVSGVRALDLSDYDDEEQFLAFVNRPEAGTRLKRGEKGERTVLVTSEVCDVLDTYIARERHEKRDDYGREPLFCGLQGRPTTGTLRSWCYLATQPCHHSDCPHGKRRDGCDYVPRDRASGCPSTRAPHHVRTGSITWHRDRGVPMEDTAERVNARPETIEKYYDKASDVQKMDARRRQYTEELDLVTNDA
jgi:site-specific recombinase XerD